MPIIKQLVRSQIHRLGFDLSAATLGALTAALALMAFGLLPEISLPLGLTLLAGLMGLATVFYVASGVYSSARTYPLGQKLMRIAASNMALFISIAGFASLFNLGAPVFAILLAGVTLGAVIQGAARYSAELVRREKMAELLMRPHHSHGGPEHILVIGGAGYIGSALVPKLLESGRKVRVLDILSFGRDPIRAVENHPNIEIVEADLRNVSDIVRCMRGIDTVVHLGGLVGDPACAVDESLTVDINVTATKIIGEIAKANGVRRFVFASSCSVYGANDLVVDESSVFNPQSLYARTKVAGEAVLREMASANFSPTFLRFATIYGVSGRTRFDLVVNLLTAKAVRDRLITVFGSDQWRPFVHVDNIARAIVKVVDAPIATVHNEAFNVGSDDQNYTLGEVAEMIKAQHPEAQITIDDEAVDRRNYRVSFEKIRTELGFEPEWTIERGIAQVGMLTIENTSIDYNDPAYSNVKFLKMRGQTVFQGPTLAGWEERYMQLASLAHSEDPKNSGSAA